MWSRTLGKFKAIRDPRVRILLWATIVSLVAGAIELGAPVENLMRIERNAIRSHPASGDIVVIGIDDKSIEAIGNWPWPRRYHAQLVDKLNALGAKRIYFDINFSRPTNPEDDGLFEAALARSRNKVTLATRLTIDPVSKNLVSLMPISRFRQHVRVANVNANINGFGEVWTLPYSMSVNGKDYPSLATDIAQKKGKTDQFFNIDYSTDIKSIPFVSAVDIIEERMPKSAVTGKTIIIATASDRIGDIYIAPGQGFSPGVFMHVLGAQTLMKGNPAEIGWLAPTVFGLLLSTLFLYIRKRTVGTGIIIGGIMLLVLVPIELESRLIFADVMPALTLILFTGTRFAWLRYREKGVAINPVSGLPNLNALKLEPAQPGRALVAARLQNFTEITATLPDDTERSLVHQIAKRLVLVAGDARIYQGDGGVFVWYADEHSFSSIDSQLDAANAIFLNPISVNDRRLDMPMTFGLDMSGSRSLTNRIASAILAADEAATEGLRWKGYDASKLVDAEWRLSLLSRLDAAIDNGEVWVAYQPKLHIATNTICGAEALVRWTHPEKGDINPEDFVLVAENNNRIEKLTHHVLDTAIRDAAEINARGIPFNISVNLSARLLDRPLLADAIFGLLKTHGLSANHLTVEVTESAAMGSTVLSIAFLEAMRAAGIGVSIDDYGTGYSSLDYLKRIPANEIKIDKGLIDSIHTNTSDRLMVSSTIELAHLLGQTVVAEGVERSETMDVLTSIGCDEAQGYLVSRPVRFGKLAARLEGDRRRAAA
jgi:diguanylate cyclase